MQFVNASLQHSNGQVRDAALELTVQLYSQVKDSYVHLVVTKVCMHFHAMFLFLSFYVAMFLFLSFYFYVISTVCASVHSDLACSLTFT